MSQRPPALDARLGNGPITALRMAGADRQRLSAARLTASGLQPFLGDALFALTPVAAPGLGTFAVDERFRLFVDPEMLIRWSVPEIAGVLLHEVGHVLRDHGTRARGIGVDETTHQQWNWAADAEINDDLVRDGAQLPGSPVLPASFGAPRGKTAELYFHVLGTGRRPATSPSCGSGAHGLTSLDPTLAEAITLGVPGLDGLSAPEVAIVRRRVADAVLALGTKPGAAPGGWVRWAESLGSPVVDWRRVLRAKVRHAVASASGGASYTDRRPPRRRIPGVVLPGPEQPSPTVAVIVDTSGSMAESDLSLAWTEVLGCLHAIGVRREQLRVYGADVATVRAAGRLGPRFALQGGGGTDMAAAIAEVLAVRPRPDVVVVLTDAETPWPSGPVGVPVIVGVTRRGADVPSWATMVHIERPRIPSLGS